MADVINVVREVSWNAGILGAIRGDSQTKALDREIDKLNEHGFRVVFIIEDRWNFIRVWANMLMAIVTVGFLFDVPNLVIVAEGDVADILADDEEERGDQPTRRSLKWGSG